MPISTRREPIADKSKTSFDATKEVNRAYERRRDDDTVKIPDSKLEDIDTSFKNFIKNVINPSIEENGNRLLVDVIYVDGEKWIAVQKHGYLRDAKQKAMTPLIGFRRTDIEIREDFRKPPVGKDQPALRWYTKTKYSPYNRYDPFSKLQATKPTIEFYSIVMPDYVRINYSVIIWTEFISQGNSIVEKFIYHNGEAHGEKYKFHMFVDSQDLETANESGTDRLVRANINCHIDTYLIPDDISDNKMNAQKALSPRKIVMSESVYDEGVTEYKQKIKNNSVVIPEEPEPPSGYSGNLLVGSFGPGPEMIGYYEINGMGDLDNTSFEGVTILGITVQAIESVNPIDILVEVSEQITDVSDINIIINEVTANLTWSSKESSYEGQSQHISDYMFDNIGETITVELEIS